MQGSMIRREGETAFAVYEIEEQFGYAIERPKELIDSIKRETVLAAASIESASQEKALGLGGRSN